VGSGKINYTEEKQALQAEFDALKAELAGL